MQQLLTTKMRVPPAHPALVPRPRLAALLRQGLAGPVTLLVAPAGFGKTTLLASSLTHMQGEERTDHTPSSAFSLQPSAFAWLSLEPADNESSRFWHYLLMALELARPGSAAPALALVQGPPPPPAEALLGALLNSLAELPAPLVLVLDDYHVIENPAIHQGMVFLLEHQPPNLRLVLASRSQPPLPLARLRARGQLLEVDADALRFQSTETAAFLQGRMGLNLPPAVVAALEGRTEGWAAGLQLAALSLRGRTDAEAFVTAFTGSNRYILDYLVDEVLALQPEETQQFLLATSILARLCGPLCAALLAKETTEADAHAAQQMLTHLERSNLFLVPLDGDGQWYRYHQLFAEALQARLRQTQLALLPQLHGRAARWFLAQEAWGESVQHAQASGDVALLAEVLEDASGPLLMGGQAHQLWRWLKQLPESESQRRPALNLFFGWAALLSGQLELVEPRLRQMEAFLSSVAHDDAVAWRGQVAAIRSYRQVVQGDVAGALAEARPAIEAMPHYDPLMRAVIGMNLGAVYALAGQMREAAQLLGEAEAVALAINNPWVALAAREFLGQIWLEQANLTQAEATFGAILASGESAPNQRLSATLALANISYERNDLALAQEWSQQLLLLARQFGIPEWLALSLLTEARVAWASGDAANARTLIAEAVGHEQRCQQPTAREIVSAMRMRLLLTMGDPDPEADWTALLENPAGFQSFQLKLPYLAAAQGLLAAGRSAEALALVQAMHSIAASAGRNASSIETLALLALAHHAQNQPDESAAALRQALELGMAAGYRRSFVDLGTAMRALLEQPARMPQARPLLAAFPPRPEAAPSQALPSSPALVEQLNERELEVLRLVAAGQSNSEVAASLVIAIGTVKKHLNNIFGKLAVGSRTQAVARARELGLL